MAAERRQPATARSDESGNRIYTWSGRGPIEEFYSVTTIIELGIPKYLVPWAAKLVAELAYGDVLARGPHSRASAIVRRWAAQGRAYVTAQREAGAKLANAKLTDSRDMALRYLKGEPERIRDAAADKGSAVHEASEEFVLERVREGMRLYVETGSVPAFDPAIAPHMTSLVAWINTHGPRILATEATVYNRSEAYAGTADLFAEVYLKGRWRRLAIDYKSGRAIYPEVAIQCAAYARAEFVGGADNVTELPIPEVDGTAVLHLTPRGPVFRELRYDEQVFRTFLYAREIFRWGIELSKTAIGDPIAQDVEDALVASVKGMA